MGTRAAPSATRVASQPSGRVGLGRAATGGVATKTAAAISAASAASFRTVKMFWVTAAGFTPT